MLEDLDVDDAESPAIGIAAAHVTWDEVADHIKIAHNPVLVGPGDDGQYSGAYWTGTQMMVAPDLGSDQDEALREFRELLREHGHL